jgi:hypothetical protein
MAGAVESRLGNSGSGQTFRSSCGHENEAGLLAARHVADIVIGDKILELLLPKVTGSPVSKEPRNGTPSISDPSPANYDSKTNPVQWDSMPAAPGQPPSLSSCGCPA